MNILEKAILMIFLRENSSFCRFLTVLNISPYYKKSSNNEHGLSQKTIQVQESLEVWEVVLIMISFYKSMNICLNQT